MNQNKTLDEFLAESFQDKELTTEYLNVALEEYLNDNDTEAFLYALEKLIKASSSMSDFAKEAKLERSHLYKILRKKVKPQFNTINSLLKAAGYKLKVVEA